MSDDFTTPRVRQGTEDAPVVHEELVDEVMQDAPLLPPRNESEQRKDDADKIPNP